MRVIGVHFFSACPFVGCLDHAWLLLDLKGKRSARLRERWRASEANRLARRMVA